MTKSDTPFWKEKSFNDMTKEEWESLCDGCGLCCLHKLEDADTGDISYTNVACRLLNTESCRCNKYTKRKKLVPDCVILTPDQVSEFKWLPKTCAYRLISEGKELLKWHPLVSGSTITVHQEGISVSGKVISERDAGDLQDHIIHVDMD
ncbi:MAG: YcgN family cysteine cluster protein [Emcibacteraceae bacterium]|nr:YcgN family cysteine cluster protein [Emcibacteraceae bacterium]MDG1859539.1 YcgN family cysteine cluster protein [Emcibacteraceae bacterium]